MTWCYQNKHIIIFFSDIIKTGNDNDTDSSDSDNSNDSFTTTDKTAFADVDESKNSENIVKDTEEVKSAER